MATNKRTYPNDYFAWYNDDQRLAIVCEDGSMFGEEYTLVSIADYILSKTPGNTVSNLSLPNLFMISTFLFFVNI